MSFKLSRLSFNSWNLLKGYFFKGKTPSLSRCRTLTSKNIDLSDRSINSHLISNQVASTSLSIYNWSKQESNIKMLWSFVIANRKLLPFLVVSPSRAVELSGQVEKPTYNAYFNVPCHAQNLVYYICGTKFRKVFGTQNLVYYIPELEVNTTYSYWKSRDGAVVRALASHQCVRIWFLGPASYVGWVCCWFSSLLQGFFSGFSSFPPSSNQHF